MSTERLRNFVAGLNTAISNQPTPTATVTILTSAGVNPQYAHYVDVGLNIAAGAALSHAYARAASIVPENPAHNIYSHEQYNRALREAMEKPVVDNSSLGAILNRLYRPNAKVGSGSTTAAIRQELANPGTKVGGASHIQKGEDAVKFLHTWLKANPGASVRDKAAAENVLLDLLDALKEKR